MSDPHVVLNDMLDAVAWEDVPPAEMPRPGSELPVVVRQAVLLLPLPAGRSVPLRVYHLSDGQRVIDADDLAAFFGGFGN